VSAQRVNISTAALVIWAKKSVPWVVIVIDRFLRLGSKS
jgi:hypothetical protein